MVNEDLILKTDTVKNTLNRKTGRPLKHNITLNKHKNAMCPRVLLQVLENSQIKCFPIVNG